MKIILFSYWYKPENKTSVNRARYFRKYLSSFGWDVNLFYYRKQGAKTNARKKTFALQGRSSFMQKLGMAFSRKQNHFFFKLIYFFYFLFHKRDIYDFYHIFRSNEMKGELIVQKNDIIITSAPPYSVFNIGFYLKNKFGASWVLDYRDPWTLSYPPISSGNLINRLRKLLHRNTELRFLNSADLVITVSQSLKDSFPEKYQSKVFVVENGANMDEMDLPKINGRPDHFSIVYSGTIYDQQMEDISFFKMLARFVRVKHILPANFKVYFIGSSGNSRLRDVIHQYHLDDYVHITERVSLDRLYGYMYEASMFLHLRYGNRSEIITSKQYDYLALQKPILLPVSDQGDIAESIRRHKAGFVCNSEDEIYEVLEMQWQAYLDGRDVRLYRRKEELYKISRQYQVERLNQILREKLPNKFNLELTTIY